MRLATAVLCALAALAGCLESPGAGDRPGADGPPPAGAGPAMELALDPALAVVDDVVTWTWTLTVREETTFDHRGCPPELVSVNVVLGEHEGVSLYEYGREPMFGACAIRPITLPPGTYSGNVSWNGHRTAEPPGPHGGDRVAPGDHPVVARLGSTDRDLEARATASVT